MSCHVALQQFSSGVFPDSYQHACTLWEKALEQLTTPIQRRDFFCTQDSDLRCQTAWLGSPEAHNVLVVIAATHGVEGFAGTAAQVDWFELLAAEAVHLPEATAILCIHALNPWGYAFSRRCDGQGVDVNRNFIDFSRPLPENPGYQALRPLLAISDKQERAAALLDFVAQVGQRDYEIAFSGGQYTDPTGPFFGGTAPSFSRQVIESLIADYNLSEKRLAVVDVHTGLGPYGYGEVICDHPCGSDSAKTAFDWYGPGCGLPDVGSSSSVPKLGLLDYAWHHIMSGDSCFVTLEFGTLGTESLFEVLYQEACVWASGNATDMEKEEQGVAMRAHFYPREQGWREAVIFRSRQVFLQALKGVSGR